MNEIQFLRPLYGGNDPIQSSVRPGVAGYEIGMESF